MKNFGIILVFLFFLSHSTQAQSNDCSKIDLALLVDGSGSAFSSWYGGGLSFTRNFLDRFNIGRDNVRVAIQEFADYGIILHSFSDTQVKSLLTNTVLPALQIRRNYETQYAKAFFMAYDDQFTRSKGDRPDVNNIAVLITDGAYYPDKGYAKREARNLANAGIKLYIIGWGIHDQQFMLDLVDGDSSRLLLIENYRQLPNEVDRFYGMICSPVVRDPNLNNFNPFPNQLDFARAFPPSLTQPGVQGQNAVSPSACNEFDLGIIVDSSASSYQEWFDTNGGMKFTSEFIKKFNVGKDNVRVSIQEFSDYGYLIYRFSDTQTTTLLMNTVIPALQIHQRYETRYEHAFQTAYRDQFTNSSGSRNYVEKVAVLLTDGSYYPDKSYGIFESDRLADAGIKLFIFAYGIDSDSERQYLRNLVNGDSNRLHMFQTPQAMTASLNTLYQLVCSSVAPRRPNFINPGQPEQARAFPQSPIVSQVAPSTGCSSIDICFLVEPTFRVMSSWHGPRGTREFLKRLMRRFTTDQPDVQTCAQLLTDDTRSLWRLHENPDKYSMDAKIRDGMPYMATSIFGFSNSLNSIMNEQFTQIYGDRSNSPNAIVIVASDYVQFAPIPEVTQAVSALQAKGVKIFAISWGRPNRNLLSALVGGASNQIIMNENDQIPFDQVENIYNGLCSLIP